MPEPLEPVRPYVRITVTGDCGHVLGIFTDKIEEKYPFWCDKCEDMKNYSRYPWTLTTEIIEPGPDAIDGGQSEDELISAMADRLDAHEVTLANG